jgi:hypothetical protein
MVCVILSSIMFFLLFDPALALPPSGFTAESNLTTQLIITGIGLLIAARFAFLAFERRIPVADEPTFPKYMTSRLHYWVGCALFMIFACLFFVIIVIEHREVIKFVGLYEKILPVGVAEINQQFLQAINEQTSTYLMIVSAMGAVYLYVLRTESEWNVLLLVRDMILRWISIPQLTGQIITLTKNSLRVPNDAIQEVIAESFGVAEQDFRKGINTIDRMWAETSYMRWWLTQARNAGGDESFFAEESFAFDRLADDLHQMSFAFEQWKLGTNPALSAEIPRLVRELHKKFSRLVACYLIYRNGSRNQLCAEAKKFGIEVPIVNSENPLRYWIVYVIVLFVSVYIGVHVSAISYDLLSGHGLILGGNTTIAIQWGLYTICNYGLAILAILSLRLAMRASQVDRNQSHLITYCWTFVVALVVGPFGITLALHFFGHEYWRSQPPLSLYLEMLRWGIGPAIVAVYISYYLDRQTYYDLPSIDRLHSTVGRRLLNCFGFAAATVFLLLPSLLSMQALPDTPSWTVDKLRFIGTGTVFLLTLGLALTAQFAIRDATARTSEGKDAPAPTGECRTNPADIMIKEAH